MKRDPSLTPTLLERPLDRRSFAGLVGLGGIAFASGLGLRPASAAEDFFFVQISDTHLGYEGPADPEAKEALPRAVAAVNALPRQPDFIVFTGDLSHTTDDGAERRKRLAAFREQAGKLTTTKHWYMPGEHDGALDRSAAFSELFGPTRYSFRHKGVTFIALDNVSDPKGILGDGQLGWLKETLSPLPKDAPVVVLTHRPLFELAPEWDWTTGDGQQAIDLLMPYTNVTVFYGHIHQEHHHVTGHIAHHAATSLVFPLPKPGSQPKRTPVAWDAAAPFKGLGWREVVESPAGAPAIAEHTIQKAVS